MRKDLFDEAGLSAPETYDDVLAAAEALDSPEVAGFVGANVAGDAFTAQTFAHLQCLGERFAGVDGAEIEEVTDFKLMREFIDRVFRKYLTPRERKILYLYYGLEEGSEAMTLEKIGALMGVTRERIRQIRERAFEKLRESPDGFALAGFWTTP